MQHRKMHTRVLGMTHVGGGGCFQQGALLYSPANCAQLPHRVKTAMDAQGGKRAGLRA
jgi:hypothetical protein